MNCLATGTSSQKERPPSTSPPPQPHPATPQSITPATMNILRDITARANSQLPSDAREPMWRIKKGRGKRGARGVAALDRPWWHPIGPGSEMTSGYGPRWDPVAGRVHKHHNGIDLACPTGTKVVAAGPGTVVKAGARGALGNVVEIQHDGGFMTRYGHADKVLTEVGKRVRQGELIATVGATGRCTGPHLHFELRKDGKPLNPCESGVCGANGQPLRF